MGCSLSTPLIYGHRIIIHTTLQKHIQLRNEGFKRTQNQSYFFLRAILFSLLRIPVSVYVQILIPECARYRNWKSDMSTLIKGSLCFQTSKEKWSLKDLLKLSGRGVMFIVIFNSVQLFQEAFHSPNFFFKVPILERCHLNSTITSPL